jgi:peptidyl-prolyl cis-trans isomerase SurA
VKFAATLRTTLAAALLAVSATATARATVVEKVVAVVGEKAILLSELRQRARPYMAQILQKVPPGVQQTEMIDTLNRQMLQRMIDEMLERQIADKHHINVTSEEIDAALDRVASSQGLTVDHLITEAVRGGITAQEYREEIRRQLLDGKLMELRVKGRVRVTDDEMRALYARIAREERQQLGYSLRWIVLRLPQGATPDAVRARRALAERLVAEARTGGDFATMARTYSDDRDTRDQGGNLGEQKPGGLEEPIERVAMTLEVGQVSAPFTFADALVIVRVDGRDQSRFGSYEEVREQLAQRVHGEQMEKARRKWLDSIRRGMHIDERL